MKPAIQGRGHLPPDPHPRRVPAPERLTASSGQPCRFSMRPMPAISTGTSGASSGPFSPQSWMRPMPAISTRTAASTRPSAAGPQPLPAGDRPMTRFGDLPLSRPAHGDYGSLEEPVRRIRAHRPLDLNAERWRARHLGGSFEVWREQARGCLLQGLHCDPGTGGSAPGGAGLRGAGRPDRGARRLRRPPPGAASKATSCGRRIHRGSPARAGRPPRLGRTHALRQGPHRQQRPRPSRAGGAPAPVLRRPLPRRGLRRRRVRGDRGRRLALRRARPPGPGRRRPRHPRQLRSLRPDRGGVRGVWTAGCGRPSTSA